MRNLFAQTVYVLIQDLQQLVMLNVGEVLEKSELLLVFKLLTHLLNVIRNLWSSSL